MSYQTVHGSTLHNIGASIELFSDALVDKCRNNTSKMTKNTVTFFTAELNKLVITSFCGTVVRWNFCITLEEIKIKCKCKIGEISPCVTTLWRDEQKIGGVPFHFFCEKCVILGGLRSRKKTTAGKVIVLNNHIKCHYKSNGIAIALKQKDTLKVFWIRL